MSDTSYGYKNVCFTILTSYCCNFSEGKDISGVMHRKVLKVPCMRCTSSLEDNEGLVNRTKRTIEMTAGVRLSVDKNRRINRWV